MHYNPLTHDQMVIVVLICSASPLFSLVQHTSMYTDSCHLIGN